LFANNRNRYSLRVLCLSQDGACTESFENFRDKSLKGDLSNDVTLNPPLLSLENTFNGENLKWLCELLKQRVSVSVSYFVTDVARDGEGCTEMDVDAAFGEKAFIKQS